MIALVPLALALVLALAGLMVSVQEDPQRARRFAAVASGVTLLVAIILTASAGMLGGLQTPGFGLTSQPLPQGLLSLAPATTAAVAFVAVSLAPLASHPPKTLARIFGLISIAEAFLVVPHAAVLPGLWAASAAIVWVEMRGQNMGRGPARVFAAYQIASIIAFAGGAALLARGSTAFGVGLLVSGIAIREAVIPVHSWFPRFVQKAPMGIVVAFAAPQLGVYAHFELLSHVAMGDVAHLLAAVGAITAVVAALLGLVQNDARRALAFFVMSQTGLVAFGLESESAMGQAGALLTWQVLALATSGFAMTLAALEARRGHLSLRVPSGSFARTPRLAIAFLFLGFASVGFPLTAGFVAEDLLVQGTVEGFPILGLSLILATAFNGMTVMKSFFALFSGQSSHHGEQDLTGRERYALTALIVVLLGSGIVPGPVLRMEEGAWSAPSGGRSGR